MPPPCVVFTMSMAFNGLGIQGGGGGEGPVTIHRVITVAAEKYFARPHTNPSANAMLVAKIFGTTNHASHIQYIRLFFSSVKLP